MKVKIRADTVEIEGYVNAVGRDSRRLTDEYGYPFVEQIQPGTFGKALEDAKREERAILCLLDHKEDHVIGETGVNLELEEDSIGLHARAVITDPETVEAAREKRLKGWSFGFNDLDYRESYGENCTRRTITELILLEVSVIDDKLIPCYAGTSIHARAEEGKQTVYTRAIDDKVEYVEDKEDPKEPEEQKPEEQKPEEAAAAPEGKPEERAGETGNKEDESPQDYSYYRNKIALLTLG